MNKLKYLTLIICLFNCFNYYSFNNDSLFIEISKLQNDSNKVKRIVNEAIKSNYNPSSSYLNLINEGLRIAKKINLQKEIHLIYNIKSCQHSNLGNIDSALLFKEKTIYTANKKDNKYLAQLLYEYADLFLYAGKLDSAEHYLGISESIVDSLDFKFHVAKGTLLLQKGEYSNALKLYFFLLKNKDLLNQDKATCYGNISLILSYQNEFKDAIRYTDSSMKINKFLGYNNKVIHDQYNIACYYSLMKKYDKAILYFDSSLFLSKKINTDKYLLHIYRSLAEVTHSKLNKQDSKIDLYYTKSITLAENSSPTDLFICLLSYTEYLSNTKNHKKAIKFADKLAKTDTTNIYKKDLISLYHVLANTYSDAGYFEKSTYFFEKTLLLNKILFNDEKTNEIFLLKTQFETQQKEEKIKLQESQITQEKQLRSFLIVGFVLIIVISVLFRAKYVSKQKLLAENQKIYTENKILEIEQKLLRVQMNPHFIFNSLSSIKSFILKQKSKEAANYLTEFSTLIRFILETSNQNFIALEEEIEMLKNYIKLEQIRLGNIFDFSIELTPNIETELDDLLIPPMIIQPFIENSIVHGFENLEKRGNLNISLSLKNETIEIIITDDGIGLIEKDKTQHQSLATKITRERLGLLENKINKPFSLTTTNLIEQKGFKTTIGIPTLTEEELLS